MLNSGRRAPSLHLPKIFITTGVIVSVASLLTTDSAQPSAEVYLLRLMPSSRRLQKTTLQQQILHFLFIGCVCSVRGKRVPVGNPITSFTRKIEGGCLKERNQQGNDYAWPRSSPEECETWPFFWSTEQILNKLLYSHALSGSMSTKSLRRKNYFLNWKGKRIKEKKKSIFSMKTTYI